MDSKTYKYIFGPVPSRRLGRSLGVDLVPLKTCTQNCIYCQLGMDGELTTQRREFVPVEDVLGEIRDFLKNGGTADFITISGSGEPTLYSKLGQLIAGIKELTTIPVCLITNSTLLSLPEVRRESLGADVVMPSLDAGNQQTYQKINQPHPDITFDSFVDGLKQFCREFHGKLWLEVFFCDGLNTDQDNINSIKNIADHLNLDSIQINTAVRPTAKESAIRVSPDVLENIAQQLGPKAIVIADYSNAEEITHNHIEVEQVLKTLKRRPCTLEDLSAGLATNANELIKVLMVLENEGQIRSEVRNEKKYFIPV